MANPIHHGGEGQGLLLRHGGRGRVVAKSLLIIIEKEGSIIRSTGIRTRPVEDFRTNQIRDVPELKALETRRSI